MGGAPTTVLSVVEAARRIYNVPHPSDEQVGRVVEKIRAGVLQRSEQGGWTTTIGAVADYMARNEAAKAAHRQKRHQGAEAPPESMEPVSKVYQGLLKDYFFGVVLRRNVSHRGAAFQRAVIGTQFTLLAAGLIFIASAASYALKKPFVPPQHRTVEAWLRQKFEDVEVESIKPVDSSKTVYSADFSYRVKRRRIDSHLNFTLRGNQVVDVNSGD